MSLYINSPGYVTQQFGVDKDIYKLCRLLEKNIDIKNYTSLLDSVGITPIVAPSSEISDDRWKELKYVSKRYRMASISMHVNYENYISSNFNEKKTLIIENILGSLLVVKKRLGAAFDYEKIKADICGLTEIVL